MKVNEDFKDSMLRTQKYLKQYKKAENEELAAINIYSSVEYFDLNRWLRHGSKDENEFLGALKRVLSAGLKHMKRYKGTAYRGTDLPADVIADYRKALKDGKPITHLAFTSTSRTSGKEFNGNVKYVIESINGRSIEKLSQFESEQEILFDAGTQFKVLEVSDVGGVTYIRLEELKKK
ncbi:ADP-ribosyltransferase [Larkinella bovis]|uniref:ADP-ribosyltransferase n=1 Tax=Larkinella bovis TaxID=683041 RepID=A0ABW0I5C5_9BACT